MSVYREGGSTHDRVNTAEAETREALAEANKAAEHAVDEVKDIARQKAEQVKTQTESKKADLSSSLKTIATELNSSASAVEGDDPWAKRTLDRGAQYVQSIASAIENQSVDEMMASGKAFARDNPAAFLGASVVAGFLASRAGKVAASRVQTHREDEDSEAVSEAASQSLSTGNTSQEMGENHAH